MKDDPRVCFDPGHGGKQPGAIFRGLNEKDVVLKVCQYAKKELAEINPNIWCCLTRDFDKTMSLRERCDFANNMKVDCFVSIHCNADPDDDSPGQPEAKGEEIWVYTGSTKGVNLARSLQDKVDLIFPEEPFRGIKESPNLYVLKHTNAPACLAEIGFIDKNSSAETFSNEVTLKKIGRLIAEGIYDYLEIYT